jgi:hypothetical protein
MEPPAKKPLSSEGEAGTALSLAVSSGILYRTFLVRSAWISAGRTVVIQAEVPVRCGAANGCRLTG